MGSNYLESVKKQFLYYKKLGEQAMEQLQEKDLFWQYNQNSNSIAVIVNHMAGNMLSRFTDFLTSDGEKSWRNRDSEFENSFTGRKELLDYWHKGWDCLLNTLDQLTANDLDSIVYIRNDGHTVTEAINRQLAHYSSHIGQIIYIANMIRDSEWKTLSIARNKSSNYNDRKFSNEKGRRHFTDNM
jgi:hypothetical protein